MSNKQSAFTLAEVLITLAIIGIVAAMTIPSLMQKTQDQEFKSAWKKQYSAMANAFSLILNENGGSVKGLCADTACFLSLFKEKLKVQKDCGTDITTNCYIQNTQAKAMGGSYGGWNALGDYTHGIITADGTYIGARLNDTNCNFNWFHDSTRTCAYFLVDVNGQKRPNTQGVDIFMVMVSANKIWPAGTENDEVYLDCNDTNDNCCGPNYSSSWFHGLGCSAKYLYQ